MRADEQFDVVVVGSGVAGLSVALACTGLRVALISRGRLATDGCSHWAQGGIAAALAEDDSPQQHAEDTFEAGAGHCSEGAVLALTTAAPEAIARLRALGVPFDADLFGRLLLGREAAHSRARIAHADGDATGAALMRAMAVEVTKRPLIRVFENTTLSALQRSVCGRVVGVDLACGGETLRLSAPATVLATGGLGQLFRYTSNPEGLWGSGLGLALDCGARLADMEFVQFHPTALAVADNSVQLPLITEALRGAGARLISGNGKRVMAGLDARLDLAPRDIVARAVWDQMQRGEQVYLDATDLPAARLRESFPGFVKVAAKHGHDPLQAPVPVVPAAHFHMGGIAVDLDGRSSVDGLWAVGEVACNGVHGANRLASNSLMEGLVFGSRLGRVLATATLPRPDPISNDGYPGAADPPDDSLRAATWRHLGLVRDRDGLQALREQCRQPGLDPRSAWSVVAAICDAALARSTSLGAHCRREQRRCA